VATRTSTPFSGSSTAPKPTCQQTKVQDRPGEAANDRKGGCGNRHCKGQ
jgi:hypothetical protein